MEKKSETWKDRLVMEFNETSERVEALNKMLENWDVGKLAFVPKTPRGIFEEQLNAMKTYKNCLEARLFIEGIVGD